jgi:hypothetical protein
MRAKIVNRFNVLIQRKLIQWHPTIEVVANVTSIA